MDTLELIVKIIVSILMLVALYYFIKVAFMILVTIALGTLGCGLVALLIGSLITPNYGWIFGLVGAAIGAIGSIILSFSGIKEIASTPFASRAMDEIGNGDPVGTKYRVKSEDGSTQIMTKEGTDILGDTILRDQNGNTHSKGFGSNEVH